MPTLTQLSHTLFVVTSFLAILSAQQYYKYRTPMARWGAAFLACIAVDLLSYSVQLVASPQSPNYIGYVIQVISFYFFVISWLLFISEISDFSKWINLQTLFIILCLPAVVLFILLTSAQEKFSHIPETGAIGSIIQLPFLIGLYGSILLAMIMSIGLISIILIIRLYFIPNRLNQKLALPMLIGTTLFMLLAGVERLGISPLQQVNLTQLGLALTSITFFFVAKIWRFGGIVPISRESVFEGMKDAALVLDYYNKVIDVNLPAQKIIGLSRQRIVNHNLSDIWPMGALLIEGNSPEAPSDKEIELSINGHNFVYTVQITKFIGLNDVPYGSQIMLRNITSHERMEKALYQKTEELQRSNAFMAALAELNVTLQSAANTSQIHATLGSEFKKLGLACFITQLAPDSNEMHLRYFSTHSDINRRIEKLLGINIIGFRLSRDQFPNLYSILDSKTITFRPFSPDDLMDSPGKLATVLLEEAIRLLGILPETPALVLPLAIGDHNLGMLGVWGSTLKESDIAPFQIFANQVAHVMERTLLYEKNIERSEELSRVNNLVMALSKVTSKLGTTINSELVLDILGQELKNAGLNCAVVTIDESGESAKIKYLSFSPELTSQIEKATGLLTKNLTVPRRFWPGNRILTQLDPIWYPRPGEHFRKMFPMVHPSAYKTSIKLLNFAENDQMCILPLNNGHRAIGGLVIWGPGLKPTDSPILSIFGSQVTGILQNLTNYESEVQRTDELTRANAIIIALSKVAAQLDTTTNLPQVYDSLGKELRKVHIYCLIGTLDSAKQNMRIDYLSILDDIADMVKIYKKHWPNNISIPRRLWPTDKAIIDRIPYWDQDPVGSTSRMFPLIPIQLIEKSFKRVGMKSKDRVCYLPMISEEDVIGILAVWGPDIQNEDIPGLSVFTNQVASAIRNAHLYDQAQKEIYERTQAEARIRETLQEKEVLLKEIHHRVKNNLQIISSLLNLQSAQTKDPMTIEILRESQTRVRSMALIHEKLYQSEDLARVNFKDYLHNLVNSLAQTYRIDSEKVKIHILCDKITLNIDTAIPCGLIINELVSNSLKYAFPIGSSGTIEVSCRKLQEKRFQLRVRDNGVGLPVAFILAESKSLGLKLVSSLVKQLGGELRMDTKQGADFEIFFTEP